MMQVSAAPSIFDVFNARQLPPQDVALSFVPPPPFDTLIKPTHTLIVGPRGSGKTTLLKMLHPAALEAWEHKDAAAVRSAINYSGVFIATDITWNEQVSSLGDGRLQPDHQRQFAKAAFTTKILQSVVDTMLHRAGRLGPAAQPHRRVVLSGRQEAEIANELIAAWHIDRSISSLDGVRAALARRNAQIRVLASQEASRGPEGRGERIASLKFLHLDFLSAAEVAVDRFNAKTKESHGRWALLFDELELAPQWIRSTLMRSLRSVDERFLFKISLSPYSVDLKKEMEGVHSAGAKQDFASIRLWYENKEQGYPFCRELLNGLLGQSNMQAAEPESLFGVSSFAADPRSRSGKKTLYRKNTAIGKQFSELAERDPSFRDYLKLRGISIESMHTIKGDKRAADLRKVRSIVALRNYFKAEEPGNRRRQERRSRKIPTVYGGATSLFAMVEGNPRWLIGIVGELLRKHKQRPIPRPAQVREVMEAGDVFRAMLRTIPCGSLGKSSRGLLSLLDPIGEFFSAAAIDSSFDPDPPCSFVVDSDTSSDQLKALGMALNAGAIIYAPDEGDVGILESVRGKRFRLSYILAPHYCIPLVLGRQLNLKSILTRPTPKRRADEPSLFPPEEGSDDKHD